MGQSLPSLPNSETSGEDVITWIFSHPDSDLSQHEKLLEDIAAMTQKEIAEIQMSTQREIEKFRATFFPEEADKVLRAAMKNPNNGGLSSKEIKKNVLKRMEDAFTRAREYFLKRSREQIAEAYQTQIIRGKTMEMEE